MGDKSLERSLESDGIAVASTEQMSLFDEEILFDQDPNKAYFKYLIGIDQETVDDGTLTGDSAIKTKCEYQTPVDVQKRWIKMAEGGRTESDVDTLEENRSLPHGGLADIPESVFGKIDVDEDFKQVTLPPVVYLGKKVSPPEQAPEQAPSAAALTPPQSNEKAFFGRNRRVMLLVLVFFFLTTVGLAVALVMFFQRPSNTGGSSDPTVATTGQGANESSDVDDEVPTVAPVNTPTKSPTVATTGQGTNGSNDIDDEVPTVAPVNTPAKSPTKEKVEGTSPVSTSAPTIAKTTTDPTSSPTTVASPTTSPTTTKTVPPTTMAPTIPPTKAPTEPPTPEPTAALPFELEELIALLASVSPDDGASLSTRTTPQFFAAQWLSKESGFTWYSDQTKIQRYVLATLYLSTSGYQWGNSSGWLTEQDECDWFTAYEYTDACNEFGELEKLYLPANNLKGPLPVELALLSNGLDRISLSGNDLSGSIPTEFGLLTNLQLLSIKQNRNIAGTLPSELGSMTLLTLLDTGELGLTGTLPSEIGLLSNLETLWLDENELEGTLPSEIGSLRKLEFVTLNSNQFVGSVPSQLLRLPALDIISFDHNSFTGVISVDRSDCYALELSADCDEVDCKCCSLCCYDGFGCA